MSKKSKPASGYHQIMPSVLEELGKAHEEMVRKQLSKPSWGPLFQPERKTKEQQ